MQTITKNEKIFSVSETSAHWTVSRKDEPVQLEVIVPKDVCETFEELSEYVREHDDIF